MGGSRLLYFVKCINDTKCNYFVLLCKCECIESFMLIIQINI